MKKLIPILTATFLFASNNINQILPKEFGKCLEVGFFDIKNAPIPLNDYMLVIKKYDCENKIIYIGIEDRVPGILKIKENKNTKDFLIKHFKIKGFNATVYIDKNLKEGVLFIQLNDKYTLKVIFNSTDYKSIIRLIEKLNLQKIKEALS